ncbi:MAG: DUF3810 domain-containing protein [Oscillospiraceae bacterium]|nr:DUF3810 domain-containing protein [Oscillospiraceae bacterium]
MSFSRVERVKNWFRDHIRIPIGVKVAICVFPVILTALFYLLRSSRDVMDWAVTYISAPVRSFFGLLSSIYPFSLMEIFCTAAVIFFVYYIIKSIKDTSRRRGKWKLLGKRLLPVFVVACYIWGLFCWLWNSGYHATGFAERYEFSNEGVAVEDLILLTQMFADKANELSELVERDNDGRYVANRREMFSESLYIYRNISQEFPSLKGRLYTPNPMIYSWFMSITGYAGMYFALTGESMINTHPPGIYMPATVAHEFAHQLGVFAEDEANFVSIIACISSDNVRFQYAGYMSGLNYLLRALLLSDPLSSAPREEWFDIMSSLSGNVLIDRQDESEFWLSRTTVTTGIAFLDRFLTNVAETTNDAVNTVYDNFLKSQNQELGIKSYGACVDLLVEYYRDDAIEHFNAG